MDVLNFLVGTVQQIALKNNIPLWFKMLRQGLQETIGICAISYRQIFILYYNINTFLGRNIEGGVLFI